MKYLLCIEIAGTNYSAFFPSVPGCIATGDTVPEVSRLAAEALALHLAGGGDAAPERAVETVLSAGDAEPGSYFTYVEPASSPVAV
jgi:predicted RNase H-like HicB family nuclease